MKLSEDFWKEEFERSMTAIRQGMNNSIPDHLMPNIQALVDNVLQPLRTERDLPIIIGSGYRCLSLNSYIGSKATSQHPKGEAADFDDWIDNRELFDLIIEMDLPYDQLIWEFGNDKRPAWIHCSHRRSKRNRKQLLRAYRDKYGIHYSPFIYKVEDNG